jgi:formate hydrogenlyase transcriptional activator
MTTTKPIAASSTNEPCADELDRQPQELIFEESEQMRSEMGFERMVGDSPALKHVLELVRTVAATDSTVLLLGETGTGKELVARAIHDCSRRKDRNFVKVNCAAIPTALLESELFGHERGAFTGATSQKMGRLELANQGTLFLDEVGDIPSEIQPKLLRALQEQEFERVGSNYTRKVNVRIVAATNRDLEEMIANKEFRTDLYYRLNVFPIRLPPLRERRDDIPMLVKSFLRKFSRQMQKNVDSVPTAVMTALNSWKWPGNIRELENFIERAVILTRGNFLEMPLADQQKMITNEAVPSVGQPPRDEIVRMVKETVKPLSVRKTPDDDYFMRQRQEILCALSESRGRVGGTNGAAMRMSINRTTLLARMKRFGIDPRQFA